MTNTNAVQTTQAQTLQTKIPAPAISVPTVSSSAMLVDLSISHWTGIKKDKKASEEVTTSKNADMGVASVSKKLLGDCAELDAIRKFVANTRNVHYAMTMPWSNSGLGMLPTKRFFDYQNTITHLQAEFSDLVEKFLAAYEWETAQAQVKLGGLHNSDEYPTIERLRGRFRFSVSYIPLPESGDWRVDMEKETTETLKQHYETYYAEALNTAMNDVWQRVHKALSNMSERLDYADDTNKKIFRDSLVNNVIDICDLLRDFNVSGSSQMEAMRVQLEDALRGVTPDALREDAHLRAQTKRNVDDILKSLPSLDI